MASTFPTSEIHAWLLTRRAWCWRAGRQIFRDLSLEVYKHEGIMLLIAFEYTKQVVNG